MSTLYGCHSCDYIHVERDLGHILHHGSIYVPAGPLTSTSQLSALTSMLQSQECANKGVPGHCFVAAVELLAFGVLESNSCG